MINLNNPSGASDLQRNRLTYLIEQRIISQCPCNTGTCACACGHIAGSAEGICLLTYDQAQDIIDDFEGKIFTMSENMPRISQKFEGIESFSKKKRVEVKSDIQYSGKCLSQFEIGKEISGEK